MEPELELKILAHIQATARHYFALKTSLETLTSFVGYSMGPDAPDPERLAHFMCLDKTQRELEAHWEVSLSQAIDKSWKLISLATVVNVEQAKRRLAYFPVSKGTQCAWCEMDEKSFASMELRPELDIKREPVPGRYLHRACARPWALLRALVERAESESG